jgi:hypothetical protein
MLSPIPVHSVCVTLQQNLKSVYLFKLCDKIKLSVNNTAINFKVFNKTHSSNESNEKIKCFINY